MINLRLVLAYIKHILKAKTRHGLHSPFVYHLADKVIYDFKPKEGYSGIEKLRTDLLHDQRIINVTDLGAGSQINNNREKKVSQIARGALKSPKLAKLIHRLAYEFKPENIIELGTCLGLTTIYLAKAVPSAKIISIEGCPQTASVAAENFKKLGIENAELHVGNFDELLPEIISKEEKLDFVFIDGNHRKETTLNYFKLCLPKITQKSVMIFDDIYWSEGMEEAWEEIKAHPKVTVTIDLFWIGLVFFKEDQAKEHFRIRL